jgi:hypothetical protein
MQDAIYIKETVMSQESSSFNAGQSWADQSWLFKTGWVILLASAALMTLNHLALMFILHNTILYMGWCAFNLYALLVIVFPFRHQERWAWYATWILPIGLAAGGATDPGISIYYFSVAAACVLGLLLTMREFFVVDRQVSQRVS